MDAEEDRLLALAEGGGVVDYTPAGYDEEEEEADFGGDAPQAGEASASIYYGQVRGCWWVGGAWWGGEWAGG